MTSATRPEPGGGAVSNAIAPDELQRALESDRITLAYQPKIALASGELVGLEALARWTDPVRGVIPPGEFVALAEASGLIDQLTRRVIEIALTQLGQWRRDGLPLAVAINVSAANLYDLGFPDALLGRAKANGVPPGDVTVEMTETIAMSDPLKVMDTVARLRLKGFRVSIDDFGTGYSSLVQLHRLPVSELKVDRSFVGPIESAPDSRVIVKAVTDLAHTLGLGVVAEGVECAGALAILRDFGCDWAQGYHIARPMAGASILHWIAARHAASS